MVAEEGLTVQQRVSRIIKKQSQKPHPDKPRVGHARGLHPGHPPYDPAGRRTSMGVSGQTAVTYGFDNANRLTQIGQGSANVSFGYDNDSRRTSLTLPNGVSMNYTYDAASQLSGITYKNGSTTLGNLTYAYDLAGRREGVGGTYARTNTPQAASSASYNVNNQLTQWKGASLTYDSNGNLTSDGTNTYTWNARNQLVSISGGVAASFQYDSFGRRVSKTIGGTTQFLYDGANPVQEISGTSASANLLTGGVDEYFQRTDSAGARNFLTDALGSTLALTDSTGTTQTSYTFEPFGNAQVTGATTNSFAFTGRELDPTGLYFYRARYYSPLLGRFIGEDPIGFGGGINKYAYAGNNPIGLRDSSGLQGSGTELYPSPLPISSGIGCNQYGIGCHSLNDPADTAVAGRKSWFNLDRTIAVNRCAATVSQYESFTVLSEGGIPNLVGSNTFGDITGVFLGPEPGTDSTVGTNERIDQGLAVGSDYVVHLSAHIIAHTAGGAAIGASLELALAAKVVVDAGVYVGALWVCAGE
jgi:RHS repeat-associated protein